MKTISCVGAGQSWGAPSVGVWTRDIPHQWLAPGRELERRAAVPSRRLFTDGQVGVHDCVRGDAPLCRGGASESGGGMRSRDPFESTSNEELSSLTAITNARKMPDHDARAVIVRFS